MPEQQLLGRTDSERLVRIETLLESLTGGRDDHETRIRRLERILWIGMGVAASLGSAAGSYVGSLPTSH